MKTLYHHLENTVNVIDKVVLVFVVIALAVIVIINSMEIFSRFVLNKSFFWVYEISLLLGNWMYFIGISLVYKRKQDIQMSYFFDFFSPKVKKIWTFMIDGAIFYFFIILLPQSFRLLLIQSRYSTPGLSIPNHYFSLPLFIGTISVILIIIQQFLGKWFHLGKKR